MGRTDGGYADLSNGTCQPQAPVGSRCSDGYNYDSYQAADYAGGTSYGEFPTCVVGAACDIPDGGRDGTCVWHDAGSTGSAPAATGAECSAYAANPCSANGDVCNGRGVCAPRGGVGGACVSSADECQAGLWCRRGAVDGGNGTCAQPIEDGHLCTDQDTCGPLSQCFNEVCTPLEQVAYDHTPVCQ